MHRGQVHIACTYAAIDKEPNTALHEGLLAEAEVPQRLQQLMQEVGLRRLSVRG